MNGKRFIIGDVLGFGWQVMKSNFWFFVGLSIVAGILQSLPGLINDLIDYLDIPELVVVLVSLPISIVGWVIGTIIGIGFIKIALSFCDGRKPRFNTLFDYQGCFWKYVGASILHSLIVLGGSCLFIIPIIIWIYIDPAILPIPIILLGLCLLIVPAIILTIKYGLCQYFVIDKGLGPVQAIKASGRTTMGVKWQLFGFGILCSLIILLGLLCLGVGIFAAYPTVMVANALVYRHLVAQTPELAQFGIGAPPAPAPVQAAALAEPQYTTPYQQPPQQII